MITWAFAYMATHGVEVWWHAFILSIFVDVLMVSMIAEAIKGRAPSTKED